MAAIAEVLNNIDFILLSITFIVSIYMMIIIAKLKKETNITNIFFIIYFLIFIWEWCLILQILLTNKYNINEINFQYIACIGTCFLPIAIYFLGKVFINREYKFKYIDIILFIIPTISLFMLWTNEKHNLFYKIYSTNINEIKYGKYFYIHIIYTYLIIAVTVVQMWKYSIEKTGLFSKQSIILIIGTLFPIVITILSYLSILNLSIYFIPILVSIGLILLVISMTKIKIISTKKFALNKAIDLVSDSFIILDSNYNIINYNKSFEKSFKLKEFEIQNANLFELINENEINSIKIDEKLFKNMVCDAINSEEKRKTFEYDLFDINKYFEVEINIIGEKKSLIVIMIFKDITQHKIDTKKIEDNQQTLIQQDRLASLGQLIGGIAHNLKTPIMSIAGNLQGLEDLVEEYHLSIRDAQVTYEDHDEIVKDMEEMIQKANVHLEYMTNIISTVKEQTIDNNIDKRDFFILQKLINSVDILMKHELKEKLVSLKFDIPDDCKNIKIRGQITGLIQVLNNLIQNAIYSYQDKISTEKVILFSVEKKDEDIIFAIKDFGCGIPESIKDKIFKEMITTKGENGTGLGLFMSYSVINEKYSGNITFDTKKDNGTTFYIKIPIYEE